MTTAAYVDRNAFRDHPLDGALLRFHPASGTHIRFENDMTRHLRRQAPRVVMFGITNKCNLSCDFCSRDVGRESAWTVQSAAAVLRDLSAAGTLEVAFGGGEPFAFRGFAELVAELHATTPLVLNVTTNGTLIREQTFSAYAGRFGQVRVSLYDDPRWRDGCKVLSHHGQQWGANLIVDDAALRGLPALLAELAALGCHDVSLLSYIGADPRKHLSMGGRTRLAAIIEESPVACRLSVCFGRSVPAPRLFDGADGGGDCGAGLDFVSITPDRRMQACSFHDGGLPASTAEEILHGWRTERARLDASSARDGCARRSLRPRRTRTVPPIAVWQAFSGNNSGECVMVAKFETVADATAYLAQLLPAWVPDSVFPPEWRRLMTEERISAAPAVEWRDTPRELLAIGRSVLAIGYAADDMHAELRALAWKKGAYVVPGGIHVHDGLMLLAAVRASSAQDAHALMEAPPCPAAATYLHGDIVLVTLPFMEGEHMPDSIAETRDLLTRFAGNRPLAAEILFEPADNAAMIAVKKHLGEEIPKMPRLAISFWGVDAETKTAKFAQLVSEGEVTVAGTCALISGIERRKRLALLAYRRGANVRALDGAELAVHAHFSLPRVPSRKGQRVEQPVIDADVLSMALRDRLSSGFHITVAPANAWGYGPSVEVRSMQPEHVLTQLTQVAQGMGASLHTWVTEIDPLAFAVRRVMAEVRS